MNFRELFGFLGTAFFCGFVIIVHVMIYDDIMNELSGYTSIHIQFSNFVWLNL